MSKLELYSSVLCPYAQRVRLALAEKGLEASEIEIDPRNKPASFLELSPEGKVPLLTHGSVRLWDSAAINEYLDEAFPAPPLLPQQPASRALARIWIKFADERIYDITHRLLLTFDPHAQRQITDQIAEDLRLLEVKAFSAHSGTYWLGETFSLVDIAFFPWFEQLAVLERFRHFQMPAECRRLLAWCEAVAERPIIRTMMRSSEYYVAGYAALFEKFAPAR